jgi:hypothetical protein
MRCELKLSRPTMHLLKSNQAGVERRLTPAREAHHGYPGGVNLAMLGEEFECTVSIHDHIETTEPRLVGYGLDDATARETIDRECRNSDLVQLSRPFVDHATGASEAT